VFLLGKYNPNKTRTVLIKLQSVRDRRIILSGAHKLSEEEHFASVLISLVSEKSLSVIKNAVSNSKPLPYPSVTLQKHLACRAESTLVGDRWCGSSNYTAAQHHAADTETTGNQVTSEMEVVIGL